MINLLLISVSEQTTVGIPNQEDGVRGFIGGDGENGYTTDEESGKRE